MRGQKRVFVIDFDNTLFDIERLRAYAYSHSDSKTKFQRAYNKAKIKTGHFEVEEMPEKYQNILLGAPFKKFVFPDVNTQIKALQKLGKVIIFSLGNHDYQKLKINESGIGRLVGEKNIIISVNKKQLIAKLIKTLQKKGFSEIIMIDDSAEILESAVNLFPRIATFWVRYGKYKNRMPIIKGSITCETESFTQAYEKLTRTIGRISPPKDHIKYLVLKGIDKHQTGNLIYYTRRDKKISKFTHDDERFRSKRSFSAWYNRGKIIYTLAGRTGKLLGIIWFAKKKFKNLTFTFAIRTYPPARGKKLAYKFMKLAYEDFQRGKKKPYLWLSVKNDNAVAKKLYKKFGFKIVEESENGEVFMGFKKD